MAVIELLAAVAGLPPTSSPVKQIDVSEAGRVLATLDDWRGIMFSQMVVIGVLILALLGVIGVAVWVAVRRSANDQATLAALQDNTRAFGELAASVRALELIAARRESERA